VEHIGEVGGFWLVRRCAACLLAGWLGQGMFLFLFLFWWKGGGKVGKRRGAVFMFDFGVCLKQKGFRGTELGNGEDGWGFLRNIVFHASLMLCSRPSSVCLQYKWVG